MGVQEGAGGKGWSAGGKGWGAGGKGWGAGGKGWGAGGKGWGRGGVQEGRDGAILPAVVVGRVPSCSSPTSLASILYLSLHLW